MRALAVGGLLKAEREECRQGWNGRKLIGRDEFAEPDFVDTKCLCKLAECELDLLLDGFDDLLGRALSRHVISLVTVGDGPAIG
jgi:hypothetical protein